MEQVATLWTASWYPLRIQLRLWRDRLRGFLVELRHRPLALLGGIVVFAYVLAAIFAPHITAHDPTRGNLRQRLLPPAWEATGDMVYPLGTDEQGRDLLTRIIFGARISLVVGLLSVGISVTVGTALGALAGYFRGRFDEILSRLADLLLAFPFLIFAIGVMAFLGPGFANLIMALTFKGWVEFFRLVRGEMLSEKTKEYVEAAKVVGQSHAAIIVSEILPNIVHSVFVLGTLRMGYMIIMEASLSFLGLGIQPPTPAWGSMVAAGRDYLLTAWWVSTVPGIALLILVLAINLFGEGLRDILDPRLRIE
ncbi:MAG TPA: ABC transporter permease [Anaerolineae bacterium]|nr:ABC transporter permease [Anaerolineae bacterium]